jgi:hypothetical protein
MSTLGFDTLGGVGVGIFFVLSGYLVTLSLERSPHLLEFARRRVLRIYPGADCDLRGLCLCAGAATDQLANGHLLASPCYLAIPVDRHRMGYPLPAARCVCQQPHVGHQRFAVVTAVRNHLLPGAGGPEPSARGAQSQSVAGSDGAGRHAAGPAPIAGPVRPVSATGLLPCQAGLAVCAGRGLRLLALAHATHAVARPCRCWLPLCCFRMAFGNCCCTCWVWAR